MSSYSVKNVSINETGYYAGSYALHSSKVRHTALQWDNVSAVCESPRTSASVRKLVVYNNLNEFLFL